jgi:hypothetical protein
LEEFFHHCFSGDPVVDVKVRLIANKLSNLVTKRENVVSKLENALAIEERDGKAPTLKTGLVGGIPGVSDAVGVIPVLGRAMTGERVNAVDGTCQYFIRYDVITVHKEELIRRLYCFHIFQPSRANWPT